MKQVGNTILAKGGNHILAKRDNSAWPKGSKLSGFSTRLARRSRNRKMVHAVQKRLNINNHISIAAIDYIKKLFVYAFIVIRHVLSKCFACLLFEEAHEMARIREIEIIRHFTDSAVGE